tara:strand:- start:1311 stop:1790 length:480 start_codon:yes stop_codon:yes gene_type:complete
MFFKSKKMKIIMYSLYIIIFDQLSKYLVLNSLGFERTKNIIPNLLNFTLVKNEGAAFSLFSNSTELLTIISFIVSIWIVIIILKFTPKSKWNLIGLSYLLGGTLGNGIDRFFRGYVLDFFELIPINFPIFNVADISINIAIVYFMIDIIKTNKESRKKY